MERYNEYKDSGVQWLGEIPSHWTIMPLKYSGRFCKGKLPSNTNDNCLGKPIIGASEMNGNMPSVYSEDNSVPQCTQNDILFLWDGANAGLVSSFHDGIVASTVTKFTCDNSNIVSTYLYYLEKNYQRYYKERVGGTTIPHMNSQYIASCPLLIPSIQEQQAIADYLDTATTKIDEAIAQQQKMIDLLNERKQIIINNAVTKGLNPDAPMKDSGVEWIGEICKNWRMYRLKHLLKTNLMYGANESAESEETSYPRYIRITDIDENGKLKPDTFRSLEPLKAEPYLLTRGDILFARSGATAGKTYLFDEDIKACFAGYLIKAQVSNKLLSRYLMYYTRSGIYDQWKNSIFIQATIQNIGADKYANLRIPLPTIEEQKTIVSYLDTETMKIDKVLDTHKRQISLLQERKQIIINDVVTGKVKVC